MVGPDGVIVIVGVGFTVIIILAESKQLPLLPVTVYVSVVPGVAVTTEQVVQLKPVDGFQV